jgi:hypothetical protein
MSTSAVSTLTTWCVSPMPPLVPERQTSTHNLTVFYLFPHRGPTQPIADLRQAHHLSVCWIFPCRRCTVLVRSLVTLRPSLQDPACSGERRASHVIHSPLPYPRAEIICMGCPGPLPSMLARAACVVVNPHLRKAGGFYVKETRVFDKTCASSQFIRV